MATIWHIIQAVQFLKKKTTSYIISFCPMQDRESYWKMMHKYIGSDITSMVTLPVIIFEPMTMLQKMAEVCLVV